MNQENWRQIPLREINQRMGSLEDFYNRLATKGFFLPNLKKGCTTAEYLYGVLIGKYFSLQRTEIRIGFALTKASKLDLFGYLKTGVNRELGFKLSQLPNRDWLEISLFTTNPDHFIFKKPPLLIKERNV